MKIGLLFPLCFLLVACASGGGGYQTPKTAQEKCMDDAKMSAFSCGLNCLAQNISVRNTCNAQCESMDIARKDRCAKL